MQRKYKGLSNLRRLHGILYGPRASPFLNSAIMRSIRFSSQVIERRYPCSGNSIINFGGNIDKVTVKNVCHFSWFVNDLTIMNYLEYRMKSIMFYVDNRLDT